MSSYLKKDGSKYKNQGMTPFEQKANYAVWMYKNKGKQSRWSLEFKDSSYPNSIYVPINWKRDPQTKKMFVELLSETTDNHIQVFWDENNITVGKTNSHKEKIPAPTNATKEIVVYKPPQETPVYTGEVIDVEFVEDKYQHNQMIEKTNQLFEIYFNNLLRSKISKANF